MEELKLEQIHNNLACQLEEYINAIIEKYGKYIPQQYLLRLQDITNYNEIIQIYDYGSINGYATKYNIKMPLCADKTLKAMSKIPGYGINKNHKSYNESNLVINNNTYINYVLHVFISGTNTEEYYEDLLLHETMHFCGSGGATALKEGINELLTRKLASEKGFRTSGCGYPKEVRIAYELQTLFGEDIINQIAFINNEKHILFFLENTLGVEAAELYSNVSEMMENEFNDKYYRDMGTYNGLTGIIKKTVNYSKIDYSQVHAIIKNFEIVHDDSLGNEFKK